MATPAWVGATPNQPQLAAQINQFLGTHAITYVYTGVSYSTQATTGSGSVASNSLYVAQQFTTGASNTAAGRVTLTMTTTGVPSPITVQVQANSAGAPSGTALVSTVIPPGWANGTPTAQSIPLPVTGLAPSTTYWIVAQAAGDVSDFFSFYKSNQSSGASTSTNGTSWTAQTYGLLYAVYDQSAILPLRHTWEDAAARITAEFTNSNATLAALEEYTNAQGGGQFVYSYRTLNYAAATLTSIS
jgi:hypothetical protein